LKSGDGLIDPARLSQPVGQVTAGGQGVGVITSEHSDPVLGECLEAGDSLIHSADVAQPARQAEPTYPAGVTFTEASNAPVSSSSTRRNQKRLFCSTQASQVSPFHPCSSPKDSKDSVDSNDSM
jgi:hypothetical protein